jgi:hypothetical protein
MPVTYNKIASVTVGAGGAANIEFTSIPGTYTDLVVKTSIRNTASNGYDNVQVSFNGAPSGTSYSARNLTDYVTAVISQSSTSASSFLYLYSSGANATASTFANSELYLPNYAGSSNKSISADSATEANSSSAFTSTRAIAAGLWAETSAITSLRLTPSSGNFAEFSTATLYGISKS